jgi:uncharacterized protein
MMVDPFLNAERQLRNGWWIVIFFVVLASLLVPTLITAQQNSSDVTIGVQAILIMLTSLACQLLRRKPLSELLGKINARWLMELCLGGLLGCVLMLIPTLILGIFGWVSFQWNPNSFSVLTSSLVLFAGVAVIEELLFRGFAFQRLISGLGQWPAQLITAAFFLLTHLNNPGMTGGIKVMAGANIFHAPILSGLAFIRTRSLAMPLGLHWMTNWIQGAILGFGVSGSRQLGFLKPVFREAPAWLTGGLFGLEASVPGLICVVAALLLLNMWRPRTGKEPTRQAGFFCKKSEVSDS